MATIYRSTDTGAPSLPPFGNYNSAGFVIDLLKACLVDGYGSKIGAGWTVDYEDTTAEKRRIAFSNGNGVIEFVTWGVRGLGFFIWDSITTPGTGAINDDDWSTVVSDGVNGWQADETAAPGGATADIMGFYLYYLNQSNAQFIDWTIVADDKACWVYFHFPEGHSDTGPGDDIDGVTNNNYHFSAFFGAIKSADLGRNELGNFFVGHGRTGDSQDTQPNSGSQPLILKFWGLRTPMGTVPTGGGDSEYGLSGFQYSFYNRNPYSSARALLPVMPWYKGSDVPMPAGENPVYSAYQFGALPGVAQIGKGDSSSTFFWVNFNVENGATWNLEGGVIDGATWIPIQISTSYNLRECGLTDDPAWW